ncbi:DUF805 domain-containing protein [Nocardioides sp.]|uniref:DUF805 domain-containing protein n=1 Tax=Nocardioides sp. TaxID=35761 RepID=UPI002722AC2A|nr:DUF805 domain-containing protein [Nocardioides sp.]MDO9454789.1 DUF805 domain-containing protein [Nocardioides sp.]
MTFADAIRSVVVENYANFSGRARRSEYWYFFLFNFLVSIVAQVVDNVIGIPILTIVVGLGLLVPGLAVSVRRLHDIDKSGWFILIALIPLVGAIILLVWACTDSKPDNQYGPNPKRLGAGAGYPA